MPLTWEQVIARPDIVGGDLESQEDGDVYRGPIKSIRIEDGIVFVELEWCAMMEGRSGTWKKSPVGILTSSFSATLSECQPRDIGNGRICVGSGAPILGMGPVIIFPKGGSKLDPSKVQGLDLASTSR